MLPHKPPHSGQDDESNERPFPDLRYDRVCRTGRSEAFLLSEGDIPLGRVDLHFGTSVVHALLVVERDLDEDDVHKLVQPRDGQVVDPAGERNETCFSTGTPALYSKVTSSNSTSPLMSVSGARAASSSMPSSVPKSTRSFASAITG